MSDIQEIIKIISLIVLGLAMVVFGADFLVRGASNIARKAGISEFVIGLTIVGMGTSAPEMVVSFLGAINGNGDITVGNVVGSNIFNTFLILGLTAMILPVGISKTNKLKDIPVAILATFMMIVLGMKGDLFGAKENGLDWYDGAVLLALFTAYTIWAFISGKKEGKNEAPGEVEAPPRSLFPSIVLVVLGLGCLALGGNLFVNNSTELAHKFRLSDKLIAITLLAGGTSLPELATCIVAAARKKGQLALGNILGSNVFNILLVLGGSALIHPISFAHMSWMDLGVLAFGSVMVWLSALTFRNDKVDRFDATVLLSVEAAYMVLLFLRQ